MAKDIEFEGKIHSFPDDATDEEINQYLGGTTEPSFGQDVSNLPMYAGNIIKGAPQELNAAAHMPLGRSLKNVAAGMLGIANIPHIAAEYYKSRHIPYLEKLAEHYPWKANLDPSHFLGLDEQQPGDIAWQSIGPGGLAKNAVKLFGKEAFNVAKAAPQVASKAISKAGDIAPITKRIATKPYKKQMKVLTEKNLLGGYAPLRADIIEASNMLKTPGMKIPHHAVDIATMEALEGNYQPWFDMQSSLRTEGRRMSKKGGVHRNFGERMHSLAEKMHEELESQQVSRGAPEASEYMRQGKARTAKHYKMAPIVKKATGITALAALPKWVGHLVRSMK